MLEKKKVFLQSLKKVGPFTNDETGEIVEGYNAFYIDVESTDDEKNLGYSPSKKFLTKEKGEELRKTGIGIYNLLISIDFGGNRPRLNVDGFEFVNKFDLNFNVKSS